VNGRKREKSKFRFILILIFFIVTIFSIDNLIPVRKIELSATTNLSVNNPYFKYRVIYGIKTYRTGSSLITEKDIIESLKKTGIHYLFLTDKREVIFEGKYQNFYIFDKKLEECKEILDPGKLKISPLNIITYIKFFLWYPINKDIAYNNIWKLYSEEQFFESFNPEKDKCFIGSIKGDIKIKFYSKTFPDLSHQIMLVKNDVILEEKIIDQLYSAKLDLYLRMDSGNLITTLYHDPGLEIFVKTDDGFFTVGDLIDIHLNPEIFIKTKRGKFITAVYKNGKVMGYFPSGIIYIKPENPGYYNIIVFSYNFRLPFNIFLGFRPVAFSNGIFIK